MGCECSASQDGVGTSPKPSDIISPRRIPTYAAGSLLDQAICANVHKAPTLPALPPPAIFTEEEARQIFAMFDTDQSGEMEAAEIVGFIKLVKGAESVDAARIVDTWDSDKDGKVQEQEFITRLLQFNTERPAWVSQIRSIVQSICDEGYLAMVQDEGTQRRSEGGSICCGEVTEQEAKKLFALFDLDSSGVMEPAEIVGFIKLVKSDENVNASKIVDTWDTNNNGLVEEEEFISRLIGFNQTKPSLVPRIRNVVKQMSDPNAVMCVGDPINRTESSSTLGQLSGIDPDDLLGDSVDPKSTSEI